MVVEGMGSCTKIELEARSRRIKWGGCGGHGGLVRWIADRPEAEESNGKVVKGMELLYDG